MACVTAFQLEGNPHYRPALVLVVWAVSIALFLAGAAALTEPRAATRDRSVFARAELVGVVVLAISALLIRTIALGRVPGNFSGDEGGMGVFARDILEGRWDDPFTTGWKGHPTLWFYAQAASLRLFGDDVVGLRVLSALIGTATVIALYLFARRWYGARVAAIAAALLTVYHLHVHFSRLGLNNVTDPLFALVVFGLFLAGWEARSPLLLGAAGASMGVAQNFYFGTRLEGVVLLTFVAHQVVVSRRRALEVARYLPLTAMGFLIGWGPGVRIPLYHWDDYNARLAQIGVFQSGWFDEQRNLGESSLNILLDQGLNAAGAITTVTDRGFDYLPGMPLLDPVSSIVFLVGLVVVLSRIAHAVSGLLLAWLVGALVFGGALLVNVPESHHLLTLAPLLCLLMAIGFDAVGRALAQFGPVSGRLAPTLTVLIVTLLALWNLCFYFRDYSPRNAYGGRNTEAATAIGTYLSTRSDAFVYFVGAPDKYLGDNTIRFLAPRASGVDVERASDQKDLAPPPRGRDPLVVFYGVHMREASAVRQRYPGGPLHVIRSTADGEPLFAAYTPSLRDWR